MSKHLVMSMELTSEGLNSKIAGVSQLDNIMAKLELAIFDGVTEGVLEDFHGNTVGQWGLEERPDVLGEFVVECNVGVYVTIDRDAGTVESVVIGDDLNSLEYKKPESIPLDVRTILDNEMWPVWTFSG